MNFGEKLRQARKNCRLTQKELAEAILLMLDERWADAETALSRLTSQPEVSEAATANLELVKLMR